MAAARASTRAGAGWVCPAVGPAEQGPAQSACVVWRRWPSHRIVRPANLRRASGCGSCPRRGVPGEVFEGIKAAVVADRYAYFKDFFDNFYNVDVLGGTRISDQALQASFITAAGASPFASYACVDTWLTDFRADLPKIGRASCR